MQTHSRPVSCTPDLINLVQVMWGYSELVHRALVAGEDVNAYTVAIAAAGNRATRSTVAALPV